MTKGRKTTFEERVEIASHCISHDHYYAETAERFKVSYQQARNYAIKYGKNGIDALKDNRGKRKPEDSLTEIERLRAELKLEKAKRKKAGNGGILPKKTQRNRQEAGLSLLRRGRIYQAIKEENETYEYPISTLCKLGNASRAAYYKWLHREIPANEVKNKRIADEIEKIHMDSPDKGYRKIRDDLERYHGIKVNDKRVLRICREKNISWQHKNCHQFLSGGRNKLLFFNCLLDGKQFRQPLLLYLIFVCLG